MKNKLLISLLTILLFTIVLCSQVFAANNNAMNSAGNSLKNAGNNVGNAAINTKDAIVNGAENFANGAANVGSNVMDAMNGTGTTTSLGTTNTNYTATRTATTGTGLFGMSTALSTWVILGVVGAIIVGLIWYYGAQYEHKNYNND